MAETAVSLLVALLTVSTAIAGPGTYFITAPSRILVNSNYDVTVDILSGSGVRVEASLLSQTYNYNTRRYDVVALKNESGIFSSGETGVISFNIEKKFSCSSCRLNIRGKGGQQFEQSTYVYVYTNVVAVLIQTDKAIYKPGQTVRFRVFAVYTNLQLYKGSFDIIIYDPNNNKIKILEDLSSDSNVVEGSLDLSDQVTFGSWKIRASTEDNDITQQIFTVEDYDLPRFEVTVELAPYALTTDSKLTGTIKAKYTFGQPVKGMVELHVGPNQGPNSCGDMPRTAQLGFEIDGEANFEMNIYDIRRVTSVYSGSTVRVTAFVVESNTGVRLNDSSTIKYYSYEYDIKFLENTAGNFKPGVPYMIYLQVTTPDGMPPKKNGISVDVYTYGSYSYRVDDQSKYSTYSFSGTYPIGGRNYHLPSSGILAVEIDIPDNATNIVIKAGLVGVTYYRYVSKYVYELTSVSGNFLQLTLQNKFIKSNTDVSIRIDGTEKLQTLTYGVLARGVTAKSGKKNCNNKRSCVLTFPVTPSMAPTAQLFVYYVRGPTEIVADAMAFNVEGIFENEVQIAFERNESEPHRNINVQLQAEQHSRVHILALDQSVLLLKSGNDIDAQKVGDQVSKYQTGAKPTSSEFPYSYTSSNFRNYFYNLGLTVMTDLSISFSSPPSYSPSPPTRPRTPGSYYGTPSTPGYPATYGSPSTPGSPSTYGSPSTPGYPSPSPSPLQEVERIRKFFPETWLYESKTITSEDGKAVINTTVPDTITSWIASAFATHPDKGLGVAATTATLRVYRPFFVNLKYPDAAIRGEQAIIQATVFNYLASTLDVTVTLKGSESFKSVSITVDNFNEKTETYLDGDQKQVIRVAAGEQGVAFFPILLTTIGVTSVEVTAQTTVAADGVQKRITVKPEGAPVSFNYPYFIDLDGNSTSSYTSGELSLSLPPSAVPDSRRVFVKVTGDLIGSSLRNIDYLLQLPTGCGEQSMVKTAPNLYIGQYLQASGQFTGDLRDRIISNLEYGYQRQLWYQRYDGSFSAFGNVDGTGSTWLTAFVTRVFTEASDFIFVDKDMLVRALEWIVSRQNLDGSFNEFGRVLSRQIQGTGTGPELTAYVLLTLLSSDRLAPRQKCIQENIDCYRAYRWGNATQKAVNNLAPQVNHITDRFTLSIVSYALTKAGSIWGQRAYARLEQYARTEGDYVYWTDESSLSRGGHSRYTSSWQPPRLQAKSIDILTTSYALLTLTKQGSITSALPVVRWLTDQKNPNGGFASTQDTIVALQALAAYATATFGPGTDLTIQAAGTGDRRRRSTSSSVTFYVTTENALSLQIQEMTTPPARLTVTGDGSGFAIAEIVHSFYVTSELTTPSFDVDTVILNEDINSFTLMVCTKWVWERQTGMVVQEIGIPSGFSPDLYSLGRVAGIRRSERQGDIVAVYFDEIGAASICYSILMTRDDKVARSQEAYIRTYDYYEPSDQATTFYLPRYLREATVCDVCYLCCFEPEEEPQSPQTPQSPQSPSTPWTTTPWTTPWTTTPTIWYDYFTSSSPPSPSPPETPTSPSSPETPTSPSSPETPTSPSSPETPTSPSSPETPTSPSSPETPTSPSSPETPTSPSSPETPTSPSSPETPTSPSPSPPYSSQTPTIWSDYFTPSSYPETPSSPPPTPTYSSQTPTIWGDYFTPSSYPETPSSPPPTPPYSSQTPTIWDESGFFSSSSSSPPTPSYPETPTSPSPPTPSYPETHGSTNDDVYYVSDPAYLFTTTEEPSTTTTEVTPGIPYTTRLPTTPPATTEAPGSPYPDDYYLMTEGPGAYTTRPVEPTTSEETPNPPTTTPEPTTTTEMTPGVPYTTRAATTPPATTEAPGSPYPGSTETPGNGRKKREAQTEKGKKNGQGKDTGPPGNGKGNGKGNEGGNGNGKKGTGNGSSETPGNGRKKREAQTGSPSSSPSPTTQADYSETPTIWDDTGFFMTSTTPSTPTTPTTTEYYYGGGYVDETHWLYYGGYYDTSETTESPESTTSAPTPLPGKGKKNGQGKDTRPPGNGKGNGNGKKETGNAPTTPPPTPTPTTTPECPVYSVVTCESGSRHVTKYDAQGCPYLVCEPVAASTPSTP